MSSPSTATVRRPEPNEWVHARRSPPAPTATWQAVLVSAPKKQIDVVGAVIVRAGKILCAQRGPHGSLGGLWEFPGGKIERGESARAALEREIVEELKCRVSVADVVATTTHEYEFGIVTLTTFYCELVSGVPELTEHSEVRWLSPHELMDLAWAPADIPAVERIVRDLSA